MATRDGLLSFRRSLVWLAGVWLGWTCSAVAQTPATRVKADNVATILERMREAAGQPAPPGRTTEFLIEGQADRAGSTSPYSVRFTPTGKFLQTLAGPLSGTVGFNGKDCWSVDLTGMPDRVVLHDLDRNRLSLGMQTAQWLSRGDPPTVALGSDARPGQRGGARHQARPVEGQAPRFARDMACQSPWNPPAWRERRPGPSPTTAAAPA